MWRMFRLAPFLYLVRFSLPSLESVPAVAGRYKTMNAWSSTGDVGDRVLVGKWTAIFHPLPATAASDIMSRVCR